AKALAGADAIQAYEEAIALYRGDLLDGSDVPTYAWLYDGEGIALCRLQPLRGGIRPTRQPLLHLVGLTDAGLRYCQQASIQPRAFRARGSRSGHCSSGFDTADQLFGQPSPTRAQAPLAAAQRSGRVLDQSAQH